MGGCGGEDENKLVRVGIVEIKVMCMRLKNSSCNKFFRDLLVMIYAMSTSFHPPSSFLPCFRKRSRDHWAFLAFLQMDRPVTSSLEKESEKMSLPEKDTKKGGIHTRGSHTHRPNHAVPAVQV